MKSREQGLKRLPVYETPEKGGKELFHRSRLIYSGFRHTIILIFFNDILNSTWHVFISSISNASFFDSQRYQNMFSGDFRSLWYSRLWTNYFEITWKVWVIVNSKLSAQQDGNYFPCLNLKLIIVISMFCTKVFRAVGNRDLQVWLRLD